MQLKTLYSIIIIGLSAACGSNSNQKKQDENTTPADTIVAKKPGYCSFT